MNLTPSEALVITQVCNGLLAKQIASRFDLSVRTVDQHLLNARRKNKAKTTHQLCAMYARFSAGLSA